MSTDRYLTIALGKGKLAKKAMELFEKIGITCEEMKDPASRKLIFVNEEQKLRFFLSKGPDVPTYVEYGAADIGIVGKDTILEENRRVYGTGFRLRQMPDVRMRSKVGGGAFKAPRKNPCGKQVSEIAKDYFR